MRLTIRYTVGLLILAALFMVFAQCVEDELGPYPLPTVPLVVMGGESP
jgi:hypothetical protein